MINWLKVRNNLNIKKGDEVVILTGKDSGKKGKVLAVLTEEGNRLKSKVENLRNRYKRMLEEELERVSYSSNDLLEEFEKEFLPASMTTHFPPAFEEDIKIAKKSETKPEVKQDLSLQLDINKSP